MAEDSVTASGGGARKRGRPRTVTDQQVPETTKCTSCSPVCLQKRRKQLRLAQQAYRRRKEDTIDALQTRVHGLESGIEELSQSFLSFSTLLLLETGQLEQHPQITSALQNITQQCVSLAKKASDEGEAASSATADDSDKTGAIPESGTPEQDVTPIHSLPTPTSDTFQTTPAPPLEWPEASLSTTAAAEASDPAILPFGLVLSSPKSSSPTFSDLFSPSPTTFLPSQLTTEQPWSLSQRLVRECCHHGYQLLVHTPDNIMKITQVFGTPLGDSERNRFITAFCTVIYGGNSNLLERKSNALAAIQPKTNVFTLEQMEISARMWKLAVQSGDVEWLDASGVQKFLRERGVRLHGDGAALGGRRRGSMPPQFDVTAFVKRELSRIYILLSLVFFFFFMIVSLTFIQSSLLVVSVLGTDRCFGDEM
ncbi:hypothetical protein NUU61_008622 [Penicillium alfredii]|uniref:BZIP domain-containing protein n=1 Tax=Penicillium alfredii TaxID=1506179 RepID=A0A9W9JWE2_9EURO|nr:uncharacterized protein NUU61_008622 [Penicillium alfredii]KAJ5084043.1 hypothetical protein NUU61_008622 [Penicillium alfredii]